MLFVLLLCPPPRNRGLTCVCLRQIRVCLAIGGRVQYASAAVSHAYSAISCEFNCEKLVSCVW